MNGKIVVEIKVPGKIDHNIAVNGKIPSKYVAQCDYLLAVSGAQVLHYWSFDGKQGVLVEFYPNQLRTNRSLKIAEQFWGYVKRREPPPENFGQKNNRKI